MGCRDGEIPSAEQALAFWGIVEQCAEPVLRGYLEESACAFAGGAYAAAIIAGWCAIARYLRLVVETLGLDLAECLYREELRRDPKSLSESVKRSDKPYLDICRRLGIFDSKQKEEIERYYNERNRHAHPNDAATTAQETLDCILSVQWLFCRQVNNERFQTKSVLECARDRLLRWSEEHAKRLIRWLPTEQRATLAITLLSSLLASPDQQGEDQDIEQKRALDLWNAIKVGLPNGASRELMRRLAEGLRADIYSDIDPMIVAQDLILWEVANEHEHSDIWQYLVARRGDLTERVKRDIRPRMPAHYQEQMDSPVEF